MNACFPPQQTYTHSRIHRHTHIHTRTHTRSSLVVFFSSIGPGPDSDSSLACLWLRLLFCFRFFVFYYYSFLPGQKDVVLCDCICCSKKNKRQKKRTFKGCHTLSRKLLFLFSCKCLETSQKLVSIFSVHSETAHIHFCSSSLDFGLDFNVVVFFSGGCKAGQV